MKCTGLALICFLPLLVTAGGCTVEDRTVISRASQTHRAIESNVINDPELTQYFQQIGDRIIQVARRYDEQQIGPELHFTDEENDWMFSNRMRFHLVNSDTLNAFTTGGEHMYIYNELLQSCDTEDELAAVMAHEYAHIYCRHVAKGQKQTVSTLVAGALLGGAAGYALGGEDSKLETGLAGAGLGAAAGQFVNMGFTRKDEEEADAYGFRFYTEAGWDPRRFADFFRKMIEKGHDKTPELLSDHPSLANRVKETERRVEKLGKDVDRHRRPPIADARRFAELKARAREVARNLPKDRTLEASQQLLVALPRSCVAAVDPPDAIQARQSLRQRAQQPPASPDKPRRRSPAS